MFLGSLAVGVFGPAALCHVLFDFLHDFLGKIIRIGIVDVCRAGGCRCLRGWLGPWQTTHRNLCHVLFDILHDFLGKIIRICIVDVCRAGGCRCLRGWLGWWGCARSAVDVCRAGGCREKTYKQENHLKSVGKTILLGRSGFLENSRGQCPKNKSVPYRSFWWFE